MAQLNNLLVNGASRFLNIIQGTAASATALTTAVGGATSPVYIGSAGTPVAINLAQASVASAASAGNAASVNNHAFGSLSTVSTITTGLLPTIPLSKISGTGSLASVSTITSGMLPTHNHTTAQITSFTSAVDDRITRDKILGEISTGATWTGTYSFVEGSNTSASGNYSHAEGYYSTASGHYSHAEGNSNRASESYTHAEGWTTWAASPCAHTEGSNTTASGSCAHAEGSRAIANKEAAHAEGSGTTASGNYSHSEGVGTLASGSQSHAEGGGTTASNAQAHAEGAGSVASGYAAHAEGGGTTASNNQSHAEGGGCLASGGSSHAEGACTTASGEISHSGGYFTIANQDYQTAIGKFNSTVDDALFVIGNGTSTQADGVTRSNAMYVTTAGYVYADQFRGIAQRRIFIVGSQTAPTTGGAWTGDASEYFQSAADLTDGQEITYWVPLPTTGNVTLDLKFGDGTSSGAVNCYYGNTSRLTTHYGQGQAVHLTYRKNVKIPSTGTNTYTGWWADANYDSNSNTIDVLQGTYTIPVAGATAGLKQYSLFAEDANGKYSSFTTQNGTAVSKAVNRTDYFDISKIYYCSTGGNYATNANIGTSVLRWAASLIDLRYTLNIANGTNGLTARKPLYLKFNSNASTVGSEGRLCYKLAGSAVNDWWTQTLPTSADDIIYVKVSEAVYDWYRADLAVKQKMYLNSIGYDAVKAAAASNTDFAKYSDGAIVFEEDAADNTGDGTIALLNFNNTGVREWNTPSTTSGLIYMSDKYSPCIRRYKDGKMLYVDSGVVDVSLMQNITLTPNKIVYMDLQGYNTYTTIAANWAISASPFTQTVSSSNQMIMGIALDSTHFYLFPENKIKDKVGHSGHAFGTYSHVANSLDVDSQIGGGTSAVYFTSAGKPAAINIAAVTVNNATNAAKVNGTAFGSLSTVSTITSGMLPSHAHTTADITSFNSAVDARITRDAVLSKISSSGVYTGDYSVAEGYKTTASGKYSHAEGDRTTATTTAAHAEGCLTTASGKYAHAEGYYTKASATAAHAEGYIAYATDDYAHAEGKDTLADAEAAHVEGELSTASGLTSHAEGYHCLASGEGAHAGGSYSTASGVVSYAKGMYLNANVDYQRVVGTYNSTVDNALLIVGSGTGIGARKNALYITTADNIAIGSGHVIDTTNSIAAGSSCYVTTVEGIATTGVNSFAFGNECTAVGDCSWAEGDSTLAYPYSHAEGVNTVASGTTAAHAEGFNVIASGDAAHAEGIGTTASGLCSHTEGYLTAASGTTAAHAEGYMTLASGAGSHAEGSQTTASNICSHSEGCLTTASGKYAHAEGFITIASGSTAAHAEGYMTLASGSRSHAEGYQTTAEGGNSHTEGYKAYTIAAAGHAEGYATNASGSTAAHAEGRMTLASGTISHAEGSLTTASDTCAHAEGGQTIASGKYSHAEGGITVASGEYSHAGGRYTIANKSAQTAIGKFNATVGSALFIVGNGSSAADTDIVRSNAMYVTTAGNINCVSVTQTSDERLKENVNPLTTTDKSILDVLEPKQFTLKQDERHQLHYGFIAQDVERQINELGFPTSSHSLIDIADNEEAYYSLNYTELIPLLVQKVKDLEQRIAQLENK